MLLLAMGFELLFMITGYVLWEWFMGIKNTTLYVFSIINVVGWVAWILYYLKYLRFKRSKKPEQEMNLKNHDTHSLK